MKKFSTSTIRATALLMVTSGAGAATILASRPAPPADPSTVAGITRLAGELNAHSDDLALAPLPSPGPSTPVTFAASQPKKTTVSSAHFRRAPVLPAVEGAGAASAKSGGTKTIAAPAVPFSPVANVALLGVTERGGVETAWLVDTQNGHRELVGEGERAYGLTVKKIGTESVTLTGEGKQYTLRLGEKRIETANASADTGAVAENSASIPAGTPANPGSFRNRGRGRGGNFGGGGGSFGGGSGGGSQLASNYGMSRSMARQFGGAGGGFNGFGGGAANGSAAMTSAFSSQSTAPTANPQTARRQNTRLIGGEAPLPVPTALANPQTSRRTGSTGTNTPAFGQASGTVGSALSQNGPSGNGRAPRQSPVQ